MVRIEAVKFIIGRSGSIIGRRLNGWGGPVILPDRHASPQPNDGDAAVCRVFYPERGGVCYATPLRRPQSQSVRFDWHSFSQPKYVDDAWITEEGKIVLSSEHGLLWPEGTRPPMRPSGELTRTFPCRIDSFDQECAVARILGDPIGEAEGLIRAAVRLRDDLTTEKARLVDNFNISAIREAEKQGQITYREVEAYSDWHPFADDHSPWAPPLAPNEKPYKKQVIAEGKDVIAHIEAEAQALAEQFEAENADRFAQVEALAQKANDIVERFRADYPGLPEPPRYAMEWL